MSETIDDPTRRLLAAVLGAGLPLLGYGVVATALRLRRRREEEWAAAQREAKARALRIATGDFRRRLDDPNVQRELRAASRML